ncbi:MAG: radical SAM protein [Flavobacteriales bacterium]|nr:radical SAM protein [Flavobacteriales bacterium]
MGNELLSASNEIDTASIQALLQAYNGADRITVLGGEPMMHAGITTILDALRHTRIREKRLTTNLTLLTEQVEESIIGSDIRVCVSIDGPAAVVHDSIRGRGSYGKTLANLNRLLPRHRNLEVIITMGRWNSDHLEGYFNFFRGLGVQMVNVHRLSLLGNALRIGDQQLQPSEWQAVVGRLSELTAAMPKGFELRYEVGYLDQEGVCRSHQQGALPPASE